MQRKKNWKNEKGSIAVIVTATLLAFYAILLGLYARGSYVRKSQLLADLALKSYYEIEVAGLVERAQNSGFAWKLATSSYSNQVAKFTIRASDDTYNVNVDLLTSNLFNGNFKIGYINNSGTMEENNADHPNAVYTDMIYVSQNMYKCVGQNDGTKVKWISYRANGTYFSTTEGDTYTRPNTDVRYVRVLWEDGLTKAESDQILIRSTYEGDTSTSTYVEPSNKIQIKINNQDVTSKVGITVYNSYSDLKRKDYVVEVRDITMEGDLTVVIPEKTMSRVVDGTTEYNYKNTLRTGIKISDV